jgi:hypothetical protein
MSNATEAQIDRRHPYSETVKEHPYATLAVAAGLAFAIGALWKIRATPRQSQLAALVSRLPELPSAERLRSYWH